jgi:regulator of sigma E protease
MGAVFSNIVVALFVLGVIIVIHELGHFLVAKYFRIRIETFSVGFGPRLVGYRYGDTDYRISAFPLGGYVKMSGENPGDDVTGDADEFLSKPKWQRFLVAAAGPAMNIVLAVVLLAGLYMYGSEVPEFLQNEARVGIVESDSPAAAAGVLPGDLILEFDGDELPNWQQVETDIIISPGRAIPLILERAGRVIRTTVTPVKRGVSEMGYSGMGPHVRVVVAAVEAGSPAEQAGILTDDEIIAVGETDLRLAGSSIQELIQQYPADVFPVTVLRGEQTLNFEVEPIVRDGQRMIGIQIPIPMVMIKLGFVAAIQRSIQTNTTNGLLIFEVLGRLFKRETSMRSLDGPIGIVRVSGQAFQAGFTTLIRLMALISLNLGILNLLPIPILDGGVMLLLLIEGVIRQDLSLAIKERIVQVSFVFLLLVTAFVLYNDVVKLLPSNQISP